MSTQSKVDLSKATDRPWKWDVEANGILDQFDKYVVVVDGEEGIRSVDAALIVQAVNSFDAMREALWQAVFAIPTTHGAFETVRAALALAEGKE